MHKHTNKKMHIKIINPKQTSIDKHSKNMIIRWHNLKNKQMGNCQGRQGKTPSGSRVISLAPRLHKHPPLFYSSRDVSLFYGQKKNHPFLAHRWTLFPLSKIAYSCSSFSSLSSTLHQVLLLPLLISFSSSLKSGSFSPLQEKSPF